MKQETQKQKIQRLEDKVKELNQLINEKVEQILHMQEAANDAFANSTDKMQLEQRIFILEKLLESGEHRVARAEKKVLAWDSRIQKLKNENECLNSNRVKRELEIENLKEEIQKLKNESSKKTKMNERGAGRKERFSEAEKQTIKMYRMQKKSIKEIANIYGCSVGLIHKIINEK